MTDASPTLIPLRVTDHAVMRYIQHVHGIDIEALRAEIRANLQRSMVAANRIDQTSYIVRTAEAGYVVENRTVVTVLRRRRRDPEALR